MASGASSLDSHLAQLTYAVQRIEAKIDRIEQGLRTSTTKSLGRSSVASDSGLQQSVEEPFSPSRQVSPAAAAADVMLLARTSVGSMAPDMAQGNFARNGSDQSLSADHGFKKLELMSCPKKPSDLVPGYTPGVTGPQADNPQQQRPHQHQGSQQLVLEEKPSSPPGEARRVSHFSEPVDVDTNLMQENEQHWLTRSDHAPATAVALQKKRLKVQGTLGQMQMEESTRTGREDSVRDAVPPLMVINNSGAGMSKMASGPQTAQLRLGSNKETHFLQNYTLGTLGNLGTMSFTSPEYDSSGKKRRKKLKSASGISEGLAADLDAALKPAKSRGQVTDHVWSFLTDPTSGLGAWMFFNLMNPLIATSTLLVLTEGTGEAPQMFIVIVEVVINAFFLIEIVLRFFTCPNKYAFAKHPYNIIDILALLPFVVRCGLGLTSTLDVMTESHRFTTAVVLGGTPFFRLLKLLRRYERFHLILRCFQESLEALPVMFYMICLISLLFATLLYIFEPRDNILHVTDALWLTIVTMLTVGYGDTYPVSAGGKLCAVGLMFAGCLFMAIPIGIIGNTFNNVWERRLQLLVVLRTRERLKMWGYHPRDIPKFFALCDRRGVGHITYKQFRTLLKAMHVTMSDHSFRMLFEVFDEDGNGTLDHWEFLKVVFPEYYFEVFRPDNDEEAPKDSTGVGPHQILDGIFRTGSALGLTKGHKKEDPSLYLSGSEESSVVQSGNLQTALGSREPVSPARQSDHTRNSRGFGEEAPSSQS
eukprot:CAMPEP_0178383520 /NCGR_PEP_ID=MMETSP0689_2-20121128/7044_1 /TAXON_ID=160604 /ORGANISM="Amphidinium massartii, Strain CS-259" /LENGTH=759 /DNA_ID=CAMNT_0020003743 /DNA_START=103 /DNA_END=2379 /DNA_ORIENTATION=+